ncbi:imidazole glycerol phosphate synthase subunit HisF [Caloramator sp. E03]|uniref:imidazole glycerol phosphate synthase subunit HisF n=1 Tax=Caloramator sp. E03 TaxID=2576307 RepID=UPI0011106029|nr:imidazole glycerol phosphate synthase subunit HisF [Caloramator sp. E03]QCX34565.1 imidazole glycerol phosphate synthase subunit HisF [Caloramator sp. E03]
MLAKRIIPCLDVKDGRVVKGKRFKDICDVDDPVKLSEYYNEEGADELVFYDITASFEKRNIFLNVVEKVAEKINIPFTVGGGINSIEDFRAALLAGADKVSVNTSAVRDPDIIKKAALKFGSQCVVLSMDVKKTENGYYKVFINGGRVETNLEAISWAKTGENLGAGEIVLNSIDCDGVKNGYDIELTRAIAEAVNIPVIASGGAGNMEHFSEVLKYGKADAALAASIFHYGDIKIKDLKDYLAKDGICVRREYYDAADKV